MKFKFNYCENRLWRIDDEYSYQISENDHSIEHFFMRGAIINFRLGKNHSLVFKHHDEFSITTTVYYTKPLTTNALAYYKKKITRNWWQMEITFEFTKQDLI